MSFPKGFNWGGAIAANQYEGGWNEGGNGSDSFGFAVLPAGYFDYDLNFNDEGSYANYWSSSDPDNLYPVFWYFYNEGDGVYDDVNDKSYGLSVRCLKD